MIASINKSLSNNNHKSYYYYSNSYNLEYIASGLWEKDSYKGFIIIGPFYFKYPLYGFYKWYYIQE